ncbi:limb region 1 protein homolog [Babylonia areolata]|uniref:limb region 1 protein homolog n=1 Tax=Babylonia areolata TaxID=304850 RepID=UPI003FCFCA47
MDDPEVTLQEQIFHNAVREHIISLLLFILLYVSSYITICQFRRRADREDMYAGEEDAAVYRIALWLCTFTLSVSGGAVLLLPMSIVSNEVLHMYPRSYYVKWLNTSLIQGLWNHIFFLSNLALFILMPFAYFFTEAEGFSGSKKGLMSRVNETVVVLGLLAVVVLGIAWLVSAFVNQDLHTKQQLFDVWHIYLPYLYSFISFIGVLLLLSCTPLGVSRMFTVMGELIVKPKFLRDIEEELNTVRLEEENLKRKLRHKNPPGQIANGHTNMDSLVFQLEEIQDRREQLEKRQQVSSWRKNLVYPLVMLLLLALTVFCVLNVAQNTILVLIGLKALPTGAKDTVLGLSSLSTFGPVGAALEIVLILYLICTAVVGFFGLPYLCRLHPRRGDTSMVKIILNCSVLLVLSSALPIVSKMLGITNFDLIGNFGSMEWLGNFYLILFINIIFAAATTLSLVTKFTATVRQEIYLRLKAAIISGEKKSSAVNGTNGAIKEDMKDD